MASVSTYLSFGRNTEEAFEFYRSIFGGEFEGRVARFGDIPPSAEPPPLADEDRHLVMHICLPILGGHRLMGTDAPESMGFALNQWNNVSISLHPDTRAETERLYRGLSEGGKIEMPLQEMFWGAYYASFSDRFGVRWMINCEEKA